MVVYFIRDKDEKINKYTVLSVLSPTTAIPIGLKCHKATLYNRLMMMSDELYVETWGRKQFFTSIYKLGIELFQIGFDVNSSEKVVDEVPRREERDAETESQTASKFGHKRYRGVDLVIKTTWKRMKWGKWMQSCNELHTSSSVSTVTSVEAMFKPQLKPSLQRFTKEMGSPSLIVNNNVIVTFITNIITIIINQSYLNIRAGLAPLWGLPTTLYSLKEHGTFI